jgi:hypothetical protein
MSLQAPKGVKKFKVPTKEECDYHPGFYIGSTWEEIWQMTQGELLGDWENAKEEDEGSNDPSQLNFYMK